MNEAGQDAGERRLKRLPQIGDRADLAEPGPAPLHAMADALRANAEALQRLDENQRRIAESIERTDKAQQVVTSTRALNETFRGLSDIQRGLLDAVVRGRRGGGGAAGSLVLLVVAAASAMLGFLGYERLFAGDRVDRRLLEEARRDTTGLRRDVLDLQAQVREGAAREADWTRRVESGRAELAAASTRRHELEQRVAGLQDDLESNRAKLDEFLAVKQRADQAGQLMESNMLLTRDNRTLKARVDQLEIERKQLYAWMGDRVIEMRGGDREAILEEARRLGVFQDPEPLPAEPGGPVVLTARGRRKVIQQLNRLMPQADEYLAVLEVGGLDDGRVLRDVTLGRYRGGLLIGSIVCKEMTLHADLERDTLELRLKEGHIENTSRRGEKIPIGADGHSEFFQEAGLGTWLRREGATVEVDGEGMLTWKTAPS